MRWIAGGTFRMGCDAAYPEERPEREASVQGFWMDVQPVTNEEFRRFVQATGYVTCAARPLDPAQYPQIPRQLLKSGSLVFQPPRAPVSLQDHTRWWAYVPGACWHQPQGPGSSIEQRAQHPVVHVTHEDALAFARWAGKSLPSEAEWEYAARGGLHGALFAWGNEDHDVTRPLANTWHGEFPWQNLSPDGHAQTSPVGSYPPNGYGLYDLIGNVWEWTVDAWEEAPQVGHSCCTPADRKAGTPGVVRRAVIKGGSHLCAPNSCFRYRPAARQGQELDSSTSHVGFRCVVRPAQEDNPAIR